MKRNRLATPEEAVEIFAGTPGYLTTVIVRESDGVIIGHTCLSRNATGLGLPVGHDTVMKSDDPLDLLRLFKFAKEILRQWGFTAFTIIEDQTTTEQLKLFWRRLGARDPVTSLTIDI